VSRNAWSDFGAFWSILAILIGLAMATVIVLKNLGTMTIPDNVGGITWPKIHLAAGVVALLFLVIKFLGNHDYTAFGLYLGLIAGAALAAGGLLMFREESAA
jgi:membrane protein CcdC involved in cytochrome C biogenesis